MWEDPIVKEVHEAREKLAERYNGDVGAFFAHVRKRQAALGERLVPPKKRAEAAAEVDAATPAGSAAPVSDSGSSTLPDATER
jgi:hypothetical protein